MTLTLEDARKIWGLWKSKGYFPVWVLFYDADNEAVQTSIRHVIVSEAVACSRS